MSSRKKKPTADAVLTEIVRNGVLAVTEEMKTNLMRTAYNMIIYEALDFTVGLFTAQGETVSIGMGLPSFIRGMANVVKANLAHFGAEGVAPGDILVTNDAYTTGSHLNHFTFSMPIFHQGKLCGWAACMAHWPDVGGTLGGVTTDIYSEGIQIPLMKYQKAGIVNQELVEIIRMNVRIPERAMGDLRAQVIAVKTGEKRFLELVRRYGREEVGAAIRNIMDNSEAAARARTRTIPDGIYEAESFMDDDGYTVGQRVPIKVRVVKRGDEMTIDLTQVSPQVQGFFNSGPSTGQSCAQVAYKCLTSPTDYPVNDGSFRSLKVIVPQGTVVSAVKPAAMRWWMTFPMTVVDTTIKALSKAIPERTAAAHHADLVFALLHGISPRDGPRRRRLGRAPQRRRHERRGVLERRRYPQQPLRAARSQVSDPLRALRAAHRLGRTRAPPRRPGNRAGGARSGADHRGCAGRAHALRPLGHRGRDGGSWQSRHHAPGRRGGSQARQREAAQPAPGGRRRGDPAHRRRRRFRLAARAPGRGRGARCASGLCERRSRALGVRRRARCRRQRRSRRHPRPAQQNLVGLRAHH